MFDEARIPCPSKVCNPIANHANKASPEVRAKCEQFILTKAHLQKYMESLLANIERGLSKATNPDAIVKCFPTYVQDLPNGTEKGRFLALDLGGTNFRVLLIELSGQHFEMKSKIFAIPQAIMTGPGEDLFNHIAECMAAFIKDENLQNEELPLGFTFSFPCTQKGLTVGILARWTKGFSCPGVVGNDVVKMLNDAIEKRGDVKILICAVLNDTTGTLMSCAHKDPKTRVGLIIGTGSNACYMEKQSKVELFDEDDMGSGQVAVNTEWGAFGDDGAIDFFRTEYDRNVDETSINPGKQVHEKMISGMYMGELVRLTLVDLVKDGLLFGGKGSELLSTRDRFYTKYVSEIEADAPGSFDFAREICEELGLKHATEQDMVNMRYVCECLSRRAAHLAAGGMTVLIKKIQEDNITIGIDGSVYRYHPHFHNLMVEKMIELLPPGTNFKLMLSEDGSGRGAALVAAVAARMKHAGK